MSLDKLRKLLNSSRLSRRELIQLGLLASALGLGTYALSKTPLVQTLMPREEVDLEVTEYSYYKPFDVLVFRDGPYAVAIDRKGKIIDKDTDHAEVIQKAIDYLPEGGKLFIKGGLYVLLRAIDIDKPIIVDGEYPTLQLAVGVRDNVIHVHDTENVIISHIIVDGKYPENPKQGSAGYPDETLQNGIQLTNVKNSLIEKVIVRNCPWNLIQIYEGCENVVVRDSYGENAGWHGFQVWRGNYSGFINCRCKGVASGQHSPFALEETIGSFVIGCISIIDGRGYDGIGLYIWPAHCIVKYNKIIDTNGSGIGIRVYGDNHIIEGNYIYKTKKGIVVCPSIDADRHYIVIRNNKIVNPYEHGILVYHQKSTRRVRAILIGNFIYRGGAQTEDPSIEVQESTRENVIIGNTIYESCGHGIVIKGLGTRCIANTILSVDQHNKGAYDGIHINADHVLVLGNQVLNINGFTCRYGIHIAGGSKNVVLLNKIDGYSAPIINNGVNTNIKHNIGYVTENSGVAVLSGDGSATEFVLGEHGLDVEVTDPTKVIVKCTPASPDAIAASPVVCYLSDEDADGVYESIRAKFANAPASGTDNVKVVWEVEYIG